MAYFVNFFCTKCHTNVSQAIGAGQPTPSVCASCQNKEDAEKRAMHLKGLEALTVEERLAKIEAWIYDYRPPVSIHDMRF